MQAWLRISLLLWVFGFFREFRPSEPFVTEYLSGPWHNITAEQVNKEIYPFGTYAVLAQLAIVFLITDILRYKPIIILSACSGIILFSILLWTDKIWELQVGQVFYGTFMATEVAYYTYIYAKVDKERYQIVTGHTRSAILCGKFLAGVLAQILISSKTMDYKDLHYFSFGSQIISFLIALLLPSVRRSLYFYTNQGTELTDRAKQNSVPHNIQTEGFIVGNAGLYVTLLQFVIAYLILLFTVASVCAISTNGAVEGGGVYFMISRTLGLEFGGSIGTLFFLANVVGCAMAISGCTEGMMENFGSGGYFTHGNKDFLPDDAWWRFLFSTIINTAMLVVCLIGAALFAKTSVLILGIVTICLLATYISFLAEGPKEIDIPEQNTIFNMTKLNYTGLNSQTLMDNLYPHYVKDYTSNGKMADFATTFGVLFAGVTGIMAGANMSGELKSPSRSIPTGTLSAVSFTFVSYILLSFLMAFTTPAVTMQNNYLFLMPINFWPPFTAIGILTATFSTGLSNLIGSSRILEALSKDQVFGSLLNFVLRGTWKGNPVAAVFTSWLLVECILLIGSLNAIAQVNSVLFMLSYLATNLACLGIELTGAPNFRPLFKYFTWHTCLIGLLGTLIMMFVINPIYASSSIILCLILVIALHLFSPASQGAQWGSISQALMFHQVRKYLLMLDSRKDHVKFWRPQMLLLVSSPRSCCPLVDFVNDMKKGGLYVIGHVKVGDYTAAVDPTIEENKYWLSFLDHMKVKAFAEVTLAKSIREGVQHLIRLSGIGAMKPNTIILGFYDSETPRDFFEAGTSPYKTEGFNHGEIQNFPIRRDGEEKHIDVAEYVAIMSDVLCMKKNLCLCRHFHRLDKNFIAKSKHLRYIDVWPINVFNPNSNNPFDVVSLFMMQLAVIINMLSKWKHLRLRVFLCESNNANTNISSFDTQMTQLDTFSRMKLEQSLKSLRIEADIIEIQEWNSESDFTSHSRILKQFTSHADEDREVITEENINRSLLYMQRANQIIRERSDQTAVSFIYLAAPPQIGTSDFKERSARYIELLTELTAELPPTILVHGISTVTSTTL